MSVLGCILSMDLISHFHSTRVSGDPFERPKLHFQLENGVLAFFMTRYFFEVSIFINSRNSSHSSLKK